MIQILPDPLMEKKMNFRVNYIKEDKFNLKIYLDNNKPDFQSYEIDSYDLATLAHECITCLSFSVKCLDRENT